MSTWISRFTFTLAGSLVLTACLPVSTGTATRALLVSEGGVTVAGPQGYCIDKSASRDGASGAFVLLGTCAALTGSRAAGQPEQAAVLTASVLPGAPEGAAFAESLPGLSAFFRSEPGRKALSRNGDAASVRIEDSITRGDVLFLRIDDASASAGQPVDRGYWRAVMAINGRIVTLAALSLRERTLSSSAKRQVLESFVAQMRASN